MMRLCALAVASFALTACPAEAKWEALRPATLQRTEVSAGRIGNAIYVAGGFVPQGNATTAIAERYDIARDRWRRISSMPVALNHAAAAVYKGRLYIVGGFGADGPETAGLLRYDPRTDRWARLPGMPTKR